MHLLFLAAGALLLAVLLLTYLTAARRRPEPRAIRDPGLSPQEADQAAALLGEALDPLGELMAHPDLGGPGCLTVQFPAGARPAASAQYPNINEGLYRRAVRRELDRQELLAAGVPAELLRLDPEFTAEGGGVVQAAVRVPRPLPAVEAGVASRTARDRTLALLAAALERRYPDMSVRRLGMDLLLTPIRRETTR